MALKDFNYKQFFFDHGERIGLGVAGAIALLMVLGLLMSGVGYLSHSAGANAEDLNKAAEGVESGLRSNQPTDADKPGDPHDKLVAFNFNIIDANAAKGYAVADLFDPIKASQAGRGMPALYQPTESQVALVRMQLPTLEFTKPALDYVLTLKNAPTTAPGGAGPGGSMPSSATVGSMFNGPARGGYNPQAALTARGSQGLRNHGFLRTKNDPQEKEEKDLDTEWVKVSTLGDKSSGAVKFAEKAYPMRIAEIVASFPYKDQVREFREKLRLPSDEAVLSELSLEEGKDGKKQNAFRFLGVTIQRRQLDAAGKPVGDKDGWATLDLDGTYKPLVIFDGKRFEEEDARLKPVIFPGLVMKKLETLGSRHTPPLDEYPKVEEKLPTLKATLDALEKKPDAMIATPALTNDPGSIFEDQSGPPNGPNGMGPGFPPPPGGSFPPGGSTPPGGSFPPNFTPPGGAFRPPYGPGALKPGQELAVPDACLIRLFDVNVEPGKTYEYRMQVRMANPNYHRTESASQTYADATELPTNSWYVLPQKLTVPNDLYYYAVDQKELDAKAPKEPAEPGKEKEKELKLPAPPVQSNQTVLQIHRWVDYLYLKNRMELPVGDWVIAERAVVTRGEPIGPQRVEVPYWRDTQDRFTMATDVPPARASRMPPSMEVPFVPENEAPVVVDFRGGDVTYRRTHPKTDDPAAATDQPPAIQDKAPLEVLLFTPDGKLQAHDSANDIPDPQRVERLQKVRDWIKNVKNSKAGGQDNTNPLGK